MNQATPRYAVFFFITVTVAALLLMALNYTIDPWMYFRDSKFSIDTGQGRHQNAGIGKHKQFSILVIGTSLSQNFLATDAENKFSGEVAVLSIPAGSGKEQNLTVANALKYQTLSRVIWELHPAAFVLDKDAVKTSSFPEYLYDNNPLTDAYYLYNLTNLKKSLSSLQEISGKKDIKPRNWKNLYAAKDNEYGCPSLLHMQIKKAGMPQQDSDLLDTSNNIADNIEANIVSLVNAHPDIQFDFFFPPFSKLYWGLIKEHEPVRYALYLQVAQTAQALLAGKENTRLYDFRAKEALSGDLNNYRDLTHYSSAANKQIISDIAKGDYQATEQGLAAFNAWVSQYATDDVVQKCLKK
ncbi:MAG: hypothetical protein P8H32_01695 [Oceanicoccus sp.]|uniref:hypothetical protein n=2 Tax=Oceanicoccus sp. TaxID=2691044 RepID=UPI002609967D|nr:hypothetical protein [Oceanicoccus sp.]MDG1772128.1 hypothetical protein [Oceanicoccus sp.]